MSALILIMGDQLSFDIPALQAADKSRDIVLLAELRDEASYVQHHKKKIAFLFSAMRHFAEALRSAGWQVDYISLTDAGNTHSLLARQNEPCTATIWMRLSQLTLLNIVSCSF